MERGPRALLRFGSAYQLVVQLSTAPWPAAPPLQQRFFAQAHLAQCGCLVLAQVCKERGAS